MAEYIAPLRDMRFVIKELAGLDAVTGLPGCHEVTPDLVDAVLDEAGKFATGVLSPLNVPGDRTGCKLDDGVVTTPPGFKVAYKESGTYLGLHYVLRSDPSAGSMVPKGSTITLYLV